MRVFVDLSKALDTDNDKILIFKREKYEEITFNRQEATFLIVSTSFITAP